VPQPVTTSPKSSPAGIAVEEDEGPTLGDRLYAVGQALGGFFAGVPLGLVPGGALGQQAAVAKGLIDPGTRSARIGLAVGEIFGGALLSAGGATGEVAGFLLSGTGVGALAGVPAIAVSTVAVVGGAANVAAGARGFAEALLSTGSGSPPRDATIPTGQRGAPLNVPAGTNTSKLIGGRYYTGHALDQMQARGFVPSVVEGAIANGARVAGNRPGTWQYVVDGVKVIVNGAGDVVTVVPQ
jgi:hypothetical protein